MRLSVHETPHDPRCFVAEIYLDGVKQDEVFTADEEQGYLERYRFDLYHRGMESVPRETLHGKVEIRLPPEEPTCVN